MRFHSLSSLTPQTLYILMSPRMGSEINPVIQSRSNDCRWFIPDVVIFALAFPFPLLVHFGAIAVSWKWIYTQNVSILIYVYQKEAQMESTMLCRLSGVFRNERRCFVQVTSSRDQDAVSVYNKWGKEKGGVCGKNGYTYSSSGDFLVQGSTCEFCWLKNTKRPNLLLVEIQGTSCMTSLETRFSTRREDCLPHRALLLHHTSLFPLRPRAPRSKLSRSHVLPPVQQSTTATNA